MPRSPATFKQADLARALKAAKAAGLPVSETRIQRDGSIVIVHAQAAAPAEELSPYDQWKAKRHARAS